MMDERNILAPRHQVEKLTIQATPQSIHSFQEAFEGELPKAVYPEIRAITADKGTRNKTYYPLENLRPNEDGTRGIITYLYPYPKPILYQHDSDSNKAEVFGRAKYVALANEGGINFVSLIPEITDPVAIQKVMDGRFLTVSIGSEADWVKCSICGCNRHEDFCDHTRGLSYKMKDGNIAECLWHMGPMIFEELSFVISPSDTDARVLRVHTDVKKVPLLKAEALKLGDHYLESRKKSWNFAVAETHRIFEAANLELPTDIEPEEEPDEVVTLGALYDLEEDDPDFNTPADDLELGESKLTSKQRNALPESVFCGPCRSFPAKDANNATVGLSLLDRSKAPNKDRIRACLQRKLAKFNDRNSCLAILTDSKLMAEFPVLTVNPGNAVEMGAMLEELGLPLKYKGDLRRRLAYLCKVEKCARPKSIEEAYDSLMDEEVPPVVIEMDGDNYPILYTVIEALTASILREERNMGETTNDELVQTEEVVEESTATQTIVEESAPATEEVVTESSEAVNTAAIEEARAEELTALLIQEKAVAKGYRAETAAVLATVLRKPIARGKEFSVLANELAARSSESLNDMVKDYLLELEGAPASTEVAHVENPTLVVIEEQQNPLGMELVSQIEVTDGTDEDDPAKSLEFLQRYNTIR